MIVLSGLALVLIISLLVIAGGKIETKMKEINASPTEFYGSKLGTVLPPEKLEKKYRYVFIQADSDINPKAYLNEHPEDAVEERCFGKIECVLYVFSDQMRSEFITK